MNSGRIGVAIFAAVAAEGGAQLKFPAALSGCVFSFMLRISFNIRRQDRGDLGSKVNPLTSYASVRSTYLEKLGSSPF